MHLLFPTTWTGPKENIHLFPVCLYYCDACSSRVHYPHLPPKTTPGKRTLRDNLWAWPGGQPTQRRAVLPKPRCAWGLSTWLGRQTAELWPPSCWFDSSGLRFEHLQVPRRCGYYGPRTTFENHWTRHCFTPTYLSATEVDHDNESQLVEKDRNIVKRCLPLDPQHKTRLFWLRGLYRTCVF